MSSSSYSLAVICVAALLQLLLVSASSLPSTKYINAVCEKAADASTPTASGNKTFCVQTLNAYPPAASATSKFQVAEAALGFSISYAQKSARFIKMVANKNPNLNKQLEECQAAYAHIVGSLKSAASELKEDPDTANYDVVMVCYDETMRVKALVEKNRDVTSKKVMTMTLKMEKVLAIAVGATELVGG